MVLVTISRGEMKLNEVSYAGIPYEDGVLDKARAVNCIYFRRDPVADLKDSLSDVQPKCGNSGLAFKNDSGVAYDKRFVPMLRF
jgi:hypothetical protein